MDLVIDWEGFDSYHVDYKQLAQNDADFAALYRTGAFDLQDPAAVRSVFARTVFELLVTLGQAIDEEHAEVQIWYHS